MPLRWLRPLLVLVAVAPPAWSQDGGPSPLPRWLSLQFEERGRWEDFTGLAYRPGRNDAYYLNRLRLELDVRPASWLRFHLQGQDSRASGHRVPVPSRVQDPVDLRLAFVDLGAFDGPGWSLRAGRQEIAYGDERLIGSGEWSNVPKSFDAVRLAWQRPGVRLEWFVAAEAVPDGEQFDRFRTDGRLAGFHASLQSKRAGMLVEPYFFWTASRDVPSEAGVIGGKDVYTAGIHFKGPLKHPFDYSFEAAAQTGNQAGDPIRAGAAALVLGYTLDSLVPGLRLFAEYDCSSGDANPTDGRVGAFDNLYPTNHGKYGIADRQGWRNMHGARAGAQKRLTGAWRLQLDYHSFWLANRNDYLYWANGAPIARNPNATSNHAGHEIDVQSLIRLNRHLELNVGWAHLFPGRFVLESTPGSPVTFAYAQLSFKAALGARQGR